MNRLLPLQELTDQLNNLLSDEVTASKREEVIEQAVWLLDQRETFIQKAIPPFSPAEQVAGRELVAVDAVVQQKLNRLFAAIKTDIRAVKQKKKSNGKYTNPYWETASLDGVFLDHKK